MFTYRNMASSLLTYQSENDRLMFESQVQQVYPSLAICVSNLLEIPEFSDQPGPSTIVSIFFVNLNVN